MGGAWPGEAEAEKGEIGGDEVGSLSWAEGGEENFTQKEGSAWHPEGPCGRTEINVAGVGRKATGVLKAVTGICSCPKCRKRSLRGSGGGGRMGVDVDFPLPIRPGKPPSPQEGERAVDDAAVSLSRHPCTHSNYLNPGENALFYS